MAIPNSLLLGSVQQGANLSIVPPSGRFLVSVWSQAQVAGNNWAPIQIFGAASTAVTWLASGGSSGLYLMQISPWAWQATIGSLSITSAAWTWCAMEVVPGTNTEIRFWTKVGTGGTVTLQVTNTAVANLATIVGIHIGDANPAESAPCYSNLVKVYSTAATPTLAALETIAQTTARDSTAWADILASWESGAGNIADRNGANSATSVIGNTATAGTMAQGVAGPLDVPAGAVGHGFWNLMVR